MVLPGGDFDFFSEKVKKKFANIKIMLNFVSG